MVFALLFNNLFSSVKPDMESEFYDDFVRLKNMLESTEKTLNKCVDSLNVLSNNGKFSEYDCDKYLSSFPKNYFVNGKEFTGYFYTIQGKNSAKSWFYSSSSGVLTDLQIKNSDDILKSVELNKWLYFKNSAGTNVLIYVVPIELNNERIGYIGAVLNMYFTQNSLFRDNYNKAFELSFLDSDGNFIFSSKYGKYASINELEQKESDIFKEILENTNSETISNKKVGHTAFMYESLTDNLTLVCQANIFELQKAGNAIIIFVSCILLVCFFMYQIMKGRENDIILNICKYVNDAGSMESQKIAIEHKTYHIAFLIILLTTIVAFVYGFFSRSGFYLPSMIISIGILEFFKLHNSDVNAGKPDELNKKTEYIIDICVVLIPAAFLFFSPMQENYSTMLIFFFATSIIITKMFCSNLSRSMNLYCLSMTSMFIAQVLGILVWKKGVDRDTLIFTAYSAFVSLFVNSAFIVFKYFDDLNHNNMKILVDKVNDTQSTLVQNEKMTALGRIMAGLSHEINTPIGAIKASADTFNSRLIDALDIIANNTRNFSPDDLNCLFTFINLSFDSVKKMLTTSDLRKGKNKVYKMLLEEGFEDDKAYHVANMLSRIEICDLDKIKETMNMLKKDNIQDILKIICDIFFLITGTNTIQLATNKVSKIMFALRTYSNIVTSDSIGEFNIVECIDSVLTLYASQFNPSIKISKIYQDDIPPIIGNPEGLGQVCTNIIQNAFYALKDGGSLIITIKYDHENIYVDFADTGCGIAEENLDKIFEPLFSTKSLGEGSGLGLDICKNIINNHGGSISVKSKLGEGTTFFVTLPLNKNSAPVKED